MKTLYYTFLFLLLIIPAFAQQDAAINDRILKVQQIKDDKERMDSLFQVANHIPYDHIKETIAAGQVLLKDAQAHDYPLGTANANLIIAQGYENVSDLPQSLKYYLEAVKNYKEVKEFYWQAIATLGVSRIYEVTTDLPNEKKYVQQAMEICLENKTDKKIRQLQPSVLDYLATIYKKEERYDTSFKLYNEAIRLAREQGDSTEVMNSSCNLATALKSDKKYDQSLATYNQVLRTLDTAKDPLFYTVITDDMAILFYHMGDLKKSEQYAFHVLHIMHSDNDNNPDAYRDMYETLRNIYIKEKKYPEALDYYAKWSAVKDSIFDRDKSEQITGWQTKYDTQAKDKEIAAQKKQLAYNLKINLSLTVISILFLSLVLIVFKSYKAQKRSNALLSIEKKRSEDLLLNILPVEVADELKNKGAADAKHFDNVTVIFTDFVNFTQASERMGPQQLINELHYFFKAFDDIIDKYNIEKIKTIGDSYLAVSGLPVADPAHAINMVRAALEINAFVHNRNTHMGGDATFEVRIGIHSGSVVAGIVGVKKFSYDIWGDTVNTAARMEQNSEPGKINISQSTYELVKNDFTCTYRGEIEAKNKGFLKMYFVQPA